MEGHREVDSSLSYSGRPYLSGEKIHTLALVPLIHEGSVIDPSLVKSGFSLVILESTDAFPSLPFPL